MKITTKIKQFLFSIDQLFKCTIGYSESVLQKFIAINGMQHISMLLFWSQIAQIRLDIHSWWNRCGMLFRTHYTQYTSMIFFSCVFFYHKNQKIFKYTIYALCHNKYKSVKLWSLRNPNRKITQTKCVEKKT